MMARMPRIADTGKVLTDDVVDAAVLLGERDAEVTLHHVADVDEVLLKHRLVEAVLGFQILANLDGHRFVVLQRISRHEVHGAEGRGGDEPNGDDALDQAFYRVREHRIRGVSHLARR